MSGLIARWFSKVFASIERSLDRASGDPNPSLRQQGLRHLNRARHRLVADPAAEAQIALDLLDEWHRKRMEDPPADPLMALMEEAGSRGRLMEAAFLAGHPERAAELANSVIRQEEEIAASWPRHDWSYGVHFANITLGHLALRAGDVDEAERRLLAAARVPKGNPALSTYGPDLELAEALLEHGSSRTVIEYLTAWRARWKVGRELIDWWVRQIVEGRPARVDRWKYLKTRRFRDVMPGLRSIPRWR